MRCSHWTETTETERTESGRIVEVAAADRCTDAATVWLCSPDGERVPGSWLCHYHAEAAIREYAAKLGEAWMARPIDDLGNLVAAEGVR